MQLVKNLHLSKHLHSRNKRSKKSNKYKTGGAKIKVLFVFFLIETFKGFENLYNYMKQIQIFEPILLLTPVVQINRFKNVNYDIETILKMRGLPYIKYHDNLNFKYTPDYIFYQTCYFNQFPERLQYPSKYFMFDKDKIKICYFNYSYSHTLKENNYSIVKRKEYDFSNNTNFILFLETDIKEDSYNNLPLIPKIITGHPAHQNIKINKNTSKKTSKKTTFLWCPRWKKNQSSYDLYWKLILDFFIPRPFLKLVIRFHPLHYTNYDILESESKKYSNIEFDTNVEIWDTFQNTDVLISDVGSLPSYFLIFNRPIIYTKVLDNNLLNDTWNIFESSFYTARNKNELNSLLNMFNNLNHVLDDPLKNQREFIINKYIKKYNPCKNISDFLISDFNKKKSHNKL